MKLGLHTAAIAVLSVVAASTRSEALHLRVQETSITENGRVHREPDIRLRTKGYGVTWTFPIGLGIAYTQLETEGESRDATRTLAFGHSYLDVMYTAGETWLTTFGYGVGVAGTVKVNDLSSSDFSATAWSLGVGYRFAPFEVYWINRLNFPRYDLAGSTLNITSTHYQLGLGLYLP